VTFSRAVSFIFSFIAAAIVLSMMGLMLVLFLSNRGPSIAESSILWLRMPSSLGEQTPHDILGLFEQRTTVSAVVDTLRKAKRDDRIAGVVIVPSTTSGMWGKVQEVRDAVIDFKTSGKPIVAYLEFGAGQAYYLATACDEIFMTPSSPLNLVGIATYDLFVKGLLDLVGFEADMLSAGEYKTAINLYTETTHTPEHREVSESLNRDMYDQLVDGIAEGRNLTPSRVRDVIDEGPFVGNDAVRFGLIDALVYQDEVVAGLGLGDFPNIVDFESYQAVTEESLGILPGPQVALIYAEGTIDFGTSSVDLQGTRTVGSQTFVEAVREAGADSSIEAIVLRIDSPGGVAIAADIMWRELKLVSAKKPLVVSMSDLAASGGYYIAAPAHAIVAQPGTLTGSIGVYGGKYVFGEALKKVGVNVEEITDGAQAGLFAPIARFSTDARSALQAQMDETYERFLQVVADGRGMTRDEVDGLARGRVWTGQQAFENGLVDALGGLQSALDLVRAEIGADPEANLVVVPYPTPSSLFDTVIDSLRTQLQSGVAEWLAPLSAQSFRSFRFLLQDHRRGQPLALMPVFVR